MGPSRRGWVWISRTSTFSVRSPSRTRSTRWVRPDLRNTLWNSSWSRVIGVASVLWPYTIAGSLPSRSIRRERLPRGWRGEAFSCMAVPLMGEPAYDTSSSAEPTAASTSRWTAADGTPSSAPDDAVWRRRDGGAGEPGQPGIADRGWLDRRHHPAGHQLHHPRDPPEHQRARRHRQPGRRRGLLRLLLELADRKSTRLNSSHSSISYAVFCLKKKNNLQYRNFLYKKKKNKKL